MPRATTNKLYRTFVKGLITEAGPLTYPEDATTDESNCVLSTGGYRSRRLGFDTENGGGVFMTSNLSSDNLAVNEFTWKSVNNDPSVNFTVVQNGTTIYFYDNSVNPMGPTILPFVVDLSGHTIDSLSGRPEESCQFASGKGYLLITNQKTAPLLVVYNAALNNITVTSIAIQIRDFKGLDDGLANDEEPSTLSSEHRYNLQNQGWLDANNTGLGSTVDTFSFWGQTLSTPQPTTSVISNYFTSQGRYPANNKQWWIAKDSTTGDFDPSLLAKFFFGTTRSPRGHYVVDAFNVDRSAVSGITGFTVDSKSYRPAACAFMGGRAWYGRDSTVYFSQIVTRKEQIGMCYQEADPTSEDISDLLPTDGGVIEIPEMTAVNRLMPLGTGVLCFATNGVWFVSGGAGGFTATDLSVTKVSPSGTESPLSVVHVQDANTDMIMYWSKVGIIGLQQRLGQFGKIDGQFDTSILTQTTIQTFFNAINPRYYPYVKSAYDTATNLVQWVFNSGDCPYVREFDSVLNFDLTLKAFYPWRLSNDSPTLGPYLVGLLETVTDTGFRNRFTKYLAAYHPVSADTQYTFVEENNGTFEDWGNVYNSYLETGYELLDDAMRDKQAMYLFTYLKRTETEYIPSGSDWTVDKPSHLTMTAKWDWANSTTANRYSSPVQVYKHIRLGVADPVSDPTFDTGFPLVVTRHKIRGHGRSLQFRFENNESGKDFILYGWAVPYSGNTNP